MINWKNLKDLDTKNPSTIKMIVAALNSEFKKASEGLAKVAEFNINNVDGNASIQFPAYLQNIIDKYHTGIKDADTGYTAAFKTINLTTGNSYSLDGISSGLTFEILKDGQQTKVYSVQGARQDYYINTIASGLNFSQQWLDDNELWRISDVSDEFVAKYYEKRASIFYALIEALTNSVTYNTDYDATASASQVDLDINTINAAAYKLIVALATAGMQINPQSELVFICPLKWRSRVLRAFGGTMNNYSVIGGVRVDYNIRPVFTTGIVTETTWADAGGTAASHLPLGYLCVPGKKNVIAERMALSIMNEQDILSFAQTITGFARFGGNINAEQWQRVLASA